MGEEVIRRRCYIAGSTENNSHWMATSNSDLSIFLSGLPRRGTGTTVYQNRITEMRPRH